ncbi:glycosyl-4,4'-diaponeurosporenoate acyltransferase [Staphylococcus borealis]|uniref:glycosyl-4,4'-diaponeurosporenoate acyltransferase CrtO family protein n=3 Tax=Staphylococcus borealis TaxID=2742203 RepID=UPI002677D498|nr:glycosyl-4,4'-diaponeurosporenoate acyltransferase [Staphylococcus borealis]
MQQLHSVITTVGGRIYSDNWIAHRVIEERGRHDGRPLFLYFNRHCSITFTDEVYREDIRTIIMSKVLNVMSLWKVLKLGLMHSVFWTTTQLSISYLMLRCPSSLFVKYDKVFTIWSWEKNGALWNTLLRINKWKRFIPEGARFNHHIYNKKRLASFKLEDIHIMIVEMRRAELVHWLSMIPVIIFVKAPKYIQFINMSYVICANLPIILTQRYNRPRLELYYQRRVKRSE